MLIPSFLQHPLTPRTQVFAKFFDSFSDAALLLPTKARTEAGEYIAWGAKLEEELGGLDLDKTPFFKG